jgi:hypothetical protein
MDCRVIPLAFAVGFFGDLLVQLLPQGPALTNYFAQHGKFESMLIAGAALTLVFSLYYLTGFKFTLASAFVIGIVMDLVARLGVIPSLMPYYRTSNFFLSIISAGIIPILLVWLAQKIVLDT